MSKRVYPVRLEEDMVRAIADLAFKTGKKPSEIIRRAIAAYLKKEAK
jgi:predicted transcriptional regulator